MTAFMAIVAGVMGLLFVLVGALLAGAGLATLCEALAARHWLQVVAAIDSSTVEAVSRRVKRMFWTTTSDKPSKAAGRSLPYCDFITISQDRGGFTPHPDQNQLRPVPSGRTGDFSCSAKKSHQKKYGAERGRDPAVLSMGEQKTWRGAGVQPPRPVLM